MKKIAVTGSYAVGKSFVIGLIKEQGYPIFVCDEFVRDLYKKNSFQKEILSELNMSAPFDKAKITDLIFSNDKYRIILENIVHPLVLNGMNEFAKQNKSAKLIFFEVPLLFETNAKDQFDKTICIYCNEELRIERAGIRANFRTETFKKINEIQIPQEQKKKLADYLIDSGNDENLIKEELNKLTKRLLND